MTNETYIDQAVNITSIRRFLLQKESIFLLLVLTFVFTVLLVVFGQPTSLTEFTEQNTTLSRLGQISITFVSGYVLVLASRIVMHLVGRRRDIQPLALLVWIVSELILCVSVMALVLWALSGGGAVHLPAMVGTLVLGFIGILLMPTVVSFLVFRLHEDRYEIIRLRQIVDSKSDTPSLLPQEGVANFYARGGRLAFSTKLTNLIFLEGADNYVNIHFLNGGKEETFILYNTLKNIEKTTTNTCLIRCHRRYMVNVDNVRLMRKDLTGLMLEMNHSPKVIPVSKSFAESITNYFAYNTNMVLPNEE